MLRNAPAALAAARIISRNSKSRLVSAEGCAELLPERGDDARGEIVELRVGERSFRALKFHADHERKLSSRHLAAAEQVGGFDAFDFSDLQRANCFDHLRERDAIREHQRKITLHRRKPRQWFETAHSVRRFDAGEERLKLQFGHENILAEFVYVR